MRSIVWEKLDFTCALNGYFYASVKQKHVSPDVWLAEQPCWRPTPHFATQSRPSIDRGPGRMPILSFVLYNHGVQGHRVKVAEDSTKHVSTR